MTLEGTEPLVTWRLSTSIPRVPALGTQCRRPPRPTPSATRPRPTSPAKLGASSAPGRHTPPPARPPRQRDHPLGRISVPTNPTGCGAAPASSPPPRRPSRISAPPAPGLPPPSSLTRGRARLRARDSVGPYHRPGLRRGSRPADAPVPEVRGARPVPHPGKTARVRELRNPVGPWNGCQTLPLHCPARAPTEKPGVVAPARAGVGGARGGGGSHSRRGEDAII